MIDKAKIERYAELKSLIKEAELEMKPLGEEILQSAVEENLEEIETDFGVFTVGHRRSYEYPQEIVEMEADLIVAKKTAAAKGEANQSEKPYLIFKSSL